LITGSADINCNSTAVAGINLCKLSSRDGDHIAAIQLEIFFHYVFAFYFTTNPKMNIPFTEKYRPKTLKEISGNEEVLTCLRSLSLDNLPNMLFYGPSGTGKTTAIRALTSELPRQNVLELNASDDRGIETVRNQIKEFSSAMMVGPKVVILDEADSMSKEAQGALRRIIEDCTNTRFCFICNYYKKIIEPIVSRCTRFRFTPVNEKSRIKEICHRENIRFDEGGIDAINRFSGGDMRKVMNDIQGVSATYDVLSEENVLEFFGMKSDVVFECMFDSLLKDDFDACRKRIASEDVDCLELITKVSVLLASSTVGKKMEILRQLGDVEQRLSVGCSDSIQLSAVISAFILNR